MVLDLAKALSHRVVLIAGEEDFVRRRALDQLKAHLEADPDLEVEHFEAGIGGPAEWVAAASTLPFLGDRRVVVVRRLLRQEPVALPKDLPETALLVLVVDEEQASDEGRRRKLESHQTGWVKQVQAAGGLVFQATSDPKQLRQALKDEAKAHGLKFGPQAVDLLVEMSGGSLGRALDELQKVALFVGDGDTITERHVDAVVVASREWNVFRLVEAALGGRTSEALEQVRVLAGGSGKMQEQLFGRVFPEVLRQLRLIWQARMCVEARVQPKQAPASIKQGFPGKPNIASAHDFVVQKSMALASKTSFEKLGRCYQLLCDAEAEMKGALPSADALDSVERMVVAMSAA